MTQDKRYHFAAGALTALVVGLPCSGSIWAGLWAALSSGILVGVCKEWCDKVYAGSWDKRDLGYTCLGVGVAMAVIVVVHLIF